MGGRDEVLRKAQTAFDEGDYRWAAQMLNHLVFAEPDFQPGRLLAADALEQLGYQAESGPWRNIYLTGALELREGVRGMGGQGRALATALTVEQIFDALGVRLVAERVIDERLLINWEFTDVDEKHVLGLENCALHHIPGRHEARADATLRLAKNLLGEILTGRVTAMDAIGDGRLEIDGDADALLVLFGALDQFDGAFNIVEP